MQRKYCIDVNNALLQQQVLIKGWVKKIRKLGKLIFLVIGDRTGSLQVVIDESNSNYEIARSLKRESVVSVLGKVNRRSQINENEINGDIELQVDSLTIYSISETTPLIIENETDALEDVRMNYRFLDLRRPIMQKNLIFRSEVLNIIRNFLINNDFIEVETPILGKPTPEGARDYLVPSRIYKSNFYALPQSPQIYKQLLMVAGLERYFQIARCFRDEDLRSDRQPEFTQLDLELSFVNELEIQTLIENLIKTLFKESLDIDVEIPFIRMDYRDAMNNYGSDKPDLRFDLKLQDCTSNFIKSSLNLFSNCKNNNNVIKSICCDTILAKQQIITLEKFAKDNGAKGLAWVTYNDANQEMTGSLAKNIELELVQQHLKQNNLNSGTILFVIDKLEICNAALGAVRNNLADLLNLKHPNVFKFLWIVNWPLYEYNEEKGMYLPAHHPFTQPQDQFHKTFTTDKENALAKAYDIVLNGFELGGGSIRITNPEMQKKMFETLRMSDEEIENKFGYLINAFKYGVPPHGGLAIGIDRLVTLMLNLTNIKDVIAFPKNNNAFDQMLKAPSVANDDNLDELGITFKN